MTKFGIEKNEKISRSYGSNALRFKRSEYLGSSRNEADRKKYTKVFSRQQLISLYNEVESYLLRHSNIDIEKLEALGREHAQYMDDLFSGKFDKHDLDLTKRLK